MRTICVLDRIRPRRDAILRALAALLDNADVVAPDTPWPDVISQLDAETIVLVGMGPASTAADFESVRTAADRGCDVLAYADHWDRVPLSLRCKALLAGASEMLDSSRQRFDAELADHVSRVIRLNEQRREETQQLSATLAGLGIIGQSRVMLSLGRWILKVGPLSDLPVLVTGETGTGKELIARAIHDLDPKRRHGPFVPLNCAALNAGLAESELFGHRRGAFTGAAEDRRGLIRAASGGMLFLDEIGDLELTLQAKLLRVLQENRVRGVGEDRENTVSVRVVAATNRDLPALVDQGAFRRDLFYRLNLLVTRVPSLAERADDIALLAEHFVEKYGAGRQMHPAPSLLAALQALDLPGNVRQLENLIRHALAQAGDDGMLGIEDLPVSAWDQLSRGTSGGADDATAGADWATVLDTNAWNLSRSLQTCERYFLEAALTRARGNQSAMARLLGITPRSIYNKMRKHHLLASERRTG